MTKERRAKIEDLFHRAMDCEEEERLRLLDETGSSDPELRREVELMLSSPEGAYSHRRNVAGGNASLADETRAAASVARMAAAESREMLIGSYRLLELIGEGGMGEVWLAEQTKPVRRQVALKLIKAGMNTREVVARFEAERQALALMDHPCIAKVFDAGSTPEGRPYFVMEYVPGIPITRYCDAHKLTIRERLELFVQVCEGVQHAHQKAIIHRDLKPSNILVVDIDGKPMPRIIDFGVAKATAHDRNAETVYTHVGAIVGTIGYMSPEQADSTTRDIDTRADVYSLGVVLYELLVGVLPFDFHRLALGEALWRLRQEDAPRPSTRLRALGARAAATSLNRGADVATLARQLRGDADAIVLKALEKDRERRYATPLDLAADIGRFLRHEPVTAHEPSLTYRAGKYARRHWIGMTAVAAFVLVLIAAATVSIRQSIRANRAAAVAQAVNDFLQNDLLAQAGASEQARPNINPDPDIKVRTALDRAAAHIEGKFQGQPLVESSIRETIGTTYEDLGLYAEAQKQLERAFELRRRALGEKNSDTLNSMNHLAELYRQQGKYAQAEPLNVKVVEVRRRLLGDEDPGTLTAMHNLASVYGYQNKYAEAEALFRKVIEIQRRVLGEENSSTLETVHDLATLYQRQGNYPQAEPLYLKAMEGFQRVLGQEHPETLVSMSGVAVVYQAQGKYAEAESLESKVLAIQRRVLGEEHLFTLNTMNHLASIYADQGKTEQAEALYITTLAIQRRVLGDEHPETLITMVGLGNVYRNQSKYPQAEMLYTESLAIQSNVLGEDYRDTRATMSNLAELDRLQHRYAQAEALLTKVLEIRRRLTGEDHPETLASINRLATVYVEEGKYAQAENLAREALTGYDKARLDTWERYMSQSLIGVSLASQGKYNEAEPLLVEGYEGMLARKNRISVANVYYVDRAREWIAELYRAWGKPEKPPQGPRN